MDGDWVAVVNATEAPACKCVFWTYLAEVVAVGQGSEDLVTVVIEYD